MKNIPTIIVILGMYTYNANLTIENFDKFIALIIMLLCWYVFTLDKRFITFFLLCVTINNFLDEILNNNLITSIFEYSLIIIFPIMWFIKSSIHAK